MNYSAYIRGKGQLLFLLFLFFSRSIAASKLETGFQALEQYDYFKAKKLFSEINASGANTYASYGLATLFSRHDNPFYNPDSAGKYVRLSYNLFQAAPKILKIAAFLVDAPSILRLSDSIVAIHLRLLKAKTTLSGCNRFLKDNYLADKKIKSEVVYLRDELEFNTVLVANESDTTQVFLLTHPQSEFFIEALLLQDRQIYDETTKDNTPTAYQKFLHAYPHSAMVNSAYEKLFQLYRQRSDIKGLREFVMTWPKALQYLEAWKLLFSLSVKSFSSAELTKFLEDYPDFPLKTSILKELALNDLVLYPYQENDFSGFINESGVPVIKAQYDSVTNFYEGLSVVSKNDSVFFINKENENPFHTVFADAYVFRHGIAAVKPKTAWCFINRQGQVTSGSYDEINDLSDGVYVLKQGNKWGAVDQFGQTLLEPRFFKLGDFKNGYAYYMENGKYGFVSKHGNPHRAEFEWISDFDSNGIAVFKRDNKYGLIRSSGIILLAPEYDQLLRSRQGIFVLVLNSNYGFFSPADCFLSPVIYDYEKDKPVDYYTDGWLLKLVKKGEQSLIDQNGRVVIPFGAYPELHFFLNGLMRVKKIIKREGKYGYLDTRLNPIIAFKYGEALDFSDSTALVVLKNKFLLIDQAGTELFASNTPLERISPHYYRTSAEDGGQVIDAHGKLIFNGLAGVSHPGPSLLIIVLNTGEIKLLHD